MRKLVAILSIVLFVACGNSQEIKSVSTTTLKTILTSEKVQLLDVRTPKEIKRGFIESAQFINFFEADFLERAVAELDKTKPVYIYCKSGGRSSKASQLLQEKGFEVYNVLGGYSQWKKENQ